MTVRDLFMVFPRMPASPPGGAPGDYAGSPGVSRDAAFVTTASFASFPVGVALIKLVETVVTQVIPAWQGLPAVLFGIALLYGAFLFYLDFTEPKGGSDKRFVVKIVIAFFNTLLLYCASLGVPVALGLGAT